MSSKFIELHSFDDGRPIIINIDSIESIYESEMDEGATTIEVNDGDYAVQESYSVLKSILMPVTLKNESKVIKMDSNITGDKIIQDLFNSLDKSRVEILPLREI